jgi:hypothetical protein
MIRSLLRSGGFVLLLAGAAMLGASHTPADLFGPIVWWMLGVG